MWPNLLLLFTLAALAVITLFLAAGVNAAVALILGAVLALFIVLRPLLGLVLTIFTNVLSPLLGSFDFSGLGLTLPRAIGAITFVSWLIWLVWRRERLSVPREMIPLSAFVAVVLLSLALQPNRLQSLLGTYMLSVGILLYLLVVTLPRRRRELLLIVGIVWSMGLVSATIGAVQYVAPGFTVLQPTEGGLDVGEGAVVDEESVASGPIRRVTGGLGDPNQFAYTVVSVLPLGIFWWKFAPARRFRALILLIVAIQLGGLALSFSRSAAVALAAAVLYLIWKRQLRASVVLPLAAAAGLIAIVVLPPEFKERMFSLEYLREGSTSYRKDVLADTVTIAKENWLFGIGYGQLGPKLYREPRSPYVREVADQIDLDSPEIHNTGAHNLLLEVWVEYGLIGLLPYLAFLFVMIRDLNALSRSPHATARDLATAVMAGLIAFMVCGVFGHLKLLKVFWLLAGIAASLRYLRLEFEKPEDSAQPAPRALAAGTP
jgi:O-antigen ligase